MYYLSADADHGLIVQCNSVPTLPLEIYCGYKLVSALLQRVTKVDGDPILLADADPVTCLAGTVEGSQHVQTLTVYNPNAGSHTVTISYTDGTLTVLVAKLTLPAGTRQDILGNGQMLRYDSAGDLDMA